MSQTSKSSTDTDRSDTPLELLTELDLLDAPPNEEFDRLMKLTNQLLEASLAQITFVADGKEWITSSVGLDVEQVDDVRSVCSKTVSQSSGPTIIDNLSEDTTVKGDTTVIQQQTYRSYAGFPITLDGTAIGAFCVWDQQPRDWSDQDRENLRLIADQVQDLIDRRRKDTLLSQEQKTLKRYRKIIDNLPIGVFRTTPEGEIVKVNPTILEIMHAESEEELKRHNLSDIYVDDSRRQEILAKLQESGSIREREVRATRLDGERFWASLSLRLVEENGQQYLDGSLRDVTDRRQTQNELEATARRLEVTTQAGGVGIWEWDVGTDDVFWDEKLQEILGHNSESYEAFLDQIHPEDQKRVENAIERAAENQDTYHEVFRIDHPESGEERWVEAQGEVRLESDSRKVMYGTARDVTDREEAYRSLEESEEQLRTIVKNTQDIFTVVSEEGKILYESPSVETVLGYDEDELLGEPAFKLIHPDDRELVYRTFDELLESDSERYHRAECRVKNAEGDWVWLEITGSSQYQPVWDGYLLSSRDITERKEAEKALRRRDRQFRQMAENVHEVFWIHDTDSEQVIYVSPAAEDIWGEPPEEFLGSSARWLNSIIEEDRDRVAKHYRENIDDEFDIQYRIERPDGEIRWIHDHGYPVTDDGNVTRLVGTARDITDRKQAEEALRERDKQFRQMAENIDEVFWMQDAETHEVLYVNPAVETVWGEPPETFYDSPERWLEAIVEEDRERVQKSFEENIHDEFDVEYRIKQPNGEIRWIHDSGYPVTDDEGNVIRLVGTARDITERKQAEQELEATVQELKETTVSRDYLDNIISTMPSTLMVVSGDGTIERVNSALCNLTDYTREELTGEPVEKVLSDDPPPEVQNLFDETDPSDIHGLELDYETRNGESIPILFSASGPGPETERFDGVICVGLDITERKETQAALEESEKRFRRMAENINEIIFMFSGDWSELLYVNPQYEEIWGQSVDKLREDPSDFMRGVHPDDRDTVREYMERATQGEELSLAYRVNKSEDYGRWIISESKPIQDENGNITRIVGTIRDITELKETQKELEQALDEKANLLKEVHHRVKNNMQIISSIISLHEHSDDVRPSKMLNECQNRITSMAMIHDMLYQSENLSDVPFSKYVEELVGSLIEFNKIPNESVDVSIDIDEDLELPLSQAVPCGLIIHELVSNACQHGFSADRENRLNVEMRDFDDHMVLRVQDNGPGFPDDFDPYELDSVGFEILRALCEHELGGTLEFSSEPMTTVEMNFELRDVRL